MSRISLYAPPADPSRRGVPWTMDPRLAAASSGIGTASEAYYYRGVGGGTISKVGLLVSAASGT